MGAVSGIGLDICLPVATRSIYRQFQRQRRTAAGPVRWPRRAAATPRGAGLFRATQSQGPRLQPRCAELQQNFYSPRTLVDFTGSRALGSAFLGVPACSQTVFLLT